MLDYLAEALRLATLLADGQIDPADYGLLGAQLVRHLALAAERVAEDRAWLAACRDALEARDVDPYLLDMERYMPAAPMQVAEVETQAVPLVRRTPAQQADDRRAANRAMDEQQGQEEYGPPTWQEIPQPAPVAAEVVQTARCSPVDTDTVPGTTLGGQASNYMATMLRLTADYSGMPRAMLEGLCQERGIRYPLGASRAKLASLLSAATAQA